MAKLERFAVRRKHRGKGYAHALLVFLMDFCRKKGFTTFYLHAQERLQPFYEGYGFRKVGSTFHFSDHGYVEMIGHAEGRLGDLHARIGRDPNHVNRPEGNMEKPGPIEASLFRSIPPSVLLESAR